MPRRLIPILAAVLASGLLGGCVRPSEDQKFPLPTSPITLFVPTQTSTPGACPQTSLAPIKIAWKSLYRTVSFGGEKAIFPNGFTAKEFPDGHLEIYAPDGSLVARDGDTITVGGTDYEHICRVGSVQY
jgi:hypothetical protein